jgi:hypothetical protein
MATFYIPAGAPHTVYGDEDNKENHWFIPSNELLNTPDVTDDDCDCDED